MGNNIFAERIKYERLKKGVKQEELAAQLEISKSRICMWETQGTVPRNDMLLKLCDYFGVTADYLLGNDVIRENPAEDTINELQRGFSKLNPEQLETAKNILKAAFKEAFGGV